MSYTRSISILRPSILVDLQAFGGSIGAVRFLVSRGHADVNAAAGNTGITPLMCSALCHEHPSKVRQCHIAGKSCLTCGKMLLGIILRS